MRSVDVLYYSLALCSFLIVAILWYVAYYLVKTLKSVEKIAKDVADITQNVEQSKNILKTYVQKGVRGIFHTIVELLYYGQNKKTARNRKRNSNV